MTSTPSRRSFLRQVAVSGTTAQILIGTQRMHASSQPLPIGLQLYTVGKEMDADPFGTLKQVASVGYKTWSCLP